MRTAATALVALAACVAPEDEPLDELSRGPAAELEPIEVGALQDRLPPEEPTWTDERPVPGIDTLVTVEDHDVKIRIEELLANDVDPEGGRVVFRYLGTMRGGVAEVASGHVIFTPEPDFTGVAFFDYVISDGRNQATGRVKVHVAPVNDAPIAFADHVSVVSGSSVTFQLDAFDPDGDPLVIDILQAPGHGALDADDSKLRYAPSPGFTGGDRLVYVASDGMSSSEPVTVELSVMPAS